MNHKWNKVDLDKLEKKMKIGGRKFICKVCGCEKHTIYGQPIYTRSGIILNYRPDCIDEKEENLKTID